MRARAVIGSILLLLSALLAACGEEQDTTKVGDIIKARADDQFTDGKEAAVVLPTGRLLIHAAAPVDSATGEDTRTRETVDAPAGAVLVPIGWQYDPWDKGRLDGIVNTTETPIIDLVTDEERYRLPPPERGAEGGESFYVVVGGDAEDRSLEIEFDGVTQSVNLANGRTEKGDAAVLYDIDEERLRKKSCDDEAWFDTPTVNAEFICDLSGPVLTPYAAGRWAPDGSLFLALTLSVEMSVYGETDRLGSGARYSAHSVDVTAEIDDEKPAYRIRSKAAADQCPARPTILCRFSSHLIFEVPEDDAEQGPLALDISYELRLINSWGSWAGADRRTVEAGETFKLWEDEDEQEDEQEQEDD